MNNGLEKNVKMPLKEAIPLTFEKKNKHKKHNNCLLLFTLKKKKRSQSKSHEDIKGNAQEYLAFNVVDFFFSFTTYGMT